jgi:hypothetical protein
VDEGGVVVSSLAVPAPVKVTAAAEAADVAPAMQTSPCWMCYDGEENGYPYHVFASWEGYGPAFYATNSVHSSSAAPGDCGMPDDHVHQCCEPDGEPGAPPAGSHSPSLRPAVERSTRELGPLSEGLRRHYENSFPHDPPGPGGRPLGMRRTS